MLNKSRHCTQMPNGLMSPALTPPSHTQLLPPLTGMANMPNNIYKFANPCGIYLWVSQPKQVQTATQSRRHLFSTAFFLTLTDRTMCPRAPLSPMKLQRQDNLHAILLRQKTSPFPNLTVWIREQRQAVISDTTLSPLRSFNFLIKRSKEFREILVSFNLQ